ncbi:MAG TPA: alpha/beta hydrolase [Verrucomicrobiales bacterium]|jgi:pimeloyl-ACP methyl ester carboxylesterase|nr:alpha/beta hydrolase [Verrucomicrobiales bacterium]
MKHLLLLLLLFPLVWVRAADAEKEVTKSQWNGFDRLDFKVDGRACLLILPKTPAPGNPWIWRTEFFGHEPQGDIALLQKGFHAAYIDVQNMYGAPVAIGHMEKFHAVLTSTWHLSTRPVLEGFSRGGLFALNWALAHPQQVSCLYLDAPVCDFKSWPGGFGKGKASPDDWKRCKQVYNLASDEDAKAWKLNPVDQCEALSKAKIPILTICGDADEVVPLAENSALLKERCGKLGLDVTLITKPGGKHHPHSLKDPGPIVEFVLKYTPAK